MFNLGTRELLIIAFVLVLLFASKKIPEFTRNLVKAGKNLSLIFRK
jgi:Sec-independent protein translocase protein TatA